MTKKKIAIPGISPELIFRLRESSFANDLFITAVSYFDFFNFLKKHPSDFDSISDSLNIKRRPLDVMLTLFKAYGFIIEKDNKYFLSDISDGYLTRESSFDLSSYVSSLKDSPVCSEMKKVLFTGKPANWAAGKNTKQWIDSMESDEFAESFTVGMNSRGAYLANGLLNVVDLKKNNKILDIGGASGIYSITLLINYPDLNATVFEKPPVDKLAQYTINKFGLNKRMNVAPGDMFKDNLPGGYDVHFISHVLHDWDFNEVKSVLSNSFENLQPGGIVIIHDAHINDTKTGPISIAEYSVLLMFLSEGKCYSTAEMKRILEETGYKDIKYRPTILNRSIITGIKPE
jgi:predicted O-methyltransferase YrrM